MRIVTEFTTKGAAEAAIKKAIKNDRITGGRAAVAFNGAGGVTHWKAHCTRGALGFCL